VKILMRSAKILSEITMVDDLLRLYKEGDGYCVYLNSVKNRTHQKAPALYVWGFGLAMAASGLIGVEATDRALGSCTPLRAPYACF